MEKAAKDEKRCPQLTRIGRKRTMQCALCPTIVTNPHLKKHHACRKHGNFVLFECGYCQKTFNVFDNQDIKSHMKRNHEEEDKSIDWGKLKDQRTKFKKEIKELTEKCFPFDNASKKKVDIGDGSEFQCLLCNSVVRRAVVRAHACTHANFVFYECGYCHRKFNDFRKLGQVKTHILNAHGREANRENFTDNREKLNEEIKEWIEKCFGHA